MKFGEKLIEAGLIDKGQLDAALSHQAQTGQRIGEALLELGYVSEVNLLRFLAREFNTQYVSTEKLSRVSVPGNLLEKVPLKLAEANLIFPILLSPDGSSLGIVACEPQDKRGITEARILAGVKKIQVFVARREAIRALVKKHYKGDIHAFDVLEEGGQDEVDQLMEGYGDRVLTHESIEMEEQAEPLSSGPVIDLSEDSDPSFTRERSSTWTKAIEAVRTRSLYSDNDFIETLNILVGLIEVQIPSRQGHSAAVAKKVKTISEQLGLKERDISHNIISSYLHDLGKRTATHLTLLSIDASAEYRRRAQRYHLTPSHLFDSVHLPPQVNGILTRLYENFDGSGLPEGLSGDSIPLGARIIAAVDAFEDLVHNSENFFEETMEPELALERLKKRSKHLFDPRVIRALQDLVLGEAAEVAQDATSQLVLVADPDQSATSALELRLLQEGFQVRVARDSLEAQECIASEVVSAAIVEMALEPDDGFVIIETILGKGRQLPVFMVASDPLPEIITRAFKEGVTDFIPKPLVPDVVVAKLNKEMDSIRQSEEARRAAVLAEEETLASVETEDAEGEGVVIEVEAQPEIIDPPEAAMHTPTPTPTSPSYSGVGGSKGYVLSGTLEGKSVLSLIRALVSKKQSGELALRDGDRKGVMYFEKGQVFEAVIDEIQGEEAFLELASWRDCLYRFDPENVPKKRAIQTSTNKLLRIAALSEA